MEKDKLIIRKINENDYEKNYLQLLNQLSKFDIDKISRRDFKNMIYKLSLNHQITVIEYKNIIIGTATLIIEQKIIHNMGCVGHIEDVVVDKDYRGYSIGKLIIDELVEIAKKNKCYKVILNCNKNNIGFYEKCGFVDKLHNMEKTIDHQVV